MVHKYYLYGTNLRTSLSIFRNMGSYLWHKLIVLNMPSLWFWMSSSESLVQTFIFAILTTGCEWDRSSSNRKTRKENVTCLCKIRIISIFCFFNCNTFISEVIDWPKVNDLYKVNTYRNPEHRLWYLSLQRIQLVVQLSNGF